MATVDVFSERMTTGQVSLTLGVSRTWVIVLILRNDLDALRTPLGYLISAESVERYQRRKEQQRQQ